MKLTFLKMFLESKQAPLKISDMDLNSLHQVLQDLIALQHDHTMARLFNRLFLMLIVSVKNANFNC